MERIEEKIKLTSRYKDEDKYIRLETELAAYEVKLTGEDMDEFKKLFAEFGEKVGNLFGMKRRKLKNDAGAD
jgi:uncharacterized lipoprotein YehR (DUF1307 family)